MKKQLFFTVISILAIGTIYGQKNWSLRVNAGIASGSSVVDGYYFSFDFGIPLTKSLEISPAFSNASMVPNTFIYNSWNSTNPIPSYGVPNGGPRQEQENGENLSSISLLLLFKPFDLIKNEKISKHELIIGAGYSFNSYTMISSQYEIIGSFYELTEFSIKSNRKFEPYYCKLGYNYLFKEKLLIGFVAGLNGFDGETELLTGLQFGIKF